MSAHRFRVVPAVFAALAALTAVTPEASSSRFFQTATQADFLKGEVENLTVDSRGQLALGPATEPIYEAAAPFIWALVPGTDGSFYMGTGNQGKVYRVDSSGKGTVFFDSAELEVHAMAPAPNGGLYVGTSPDGKIYKIDRSGSASAFFDPDDRYIWAMTVDSRGNLYAGTGDKGVIYKIAPDGKGVPFYKTKSTHATALAMDRAGNLLVGTDSPGKVIRVDPDGKGFVLLDTPYQEIRSLRFDDKGQLYAAALSGRPAGGAPVVSGGDQTPGDTGRAPAPSVSVSTEITSIAIVDGGGSTPSSPSRSDDRRASKGALYRILPDGLWDLIWDSRDDVPYDVTFDRSGAPIVATGNKGKLYRLDGDPLRPTLLTRASAQQVTAFYKDQRGQVYFATANPGKLFRLSTEHAARGTYESEPGDAQMLATWGTLSWRGTVPKNGRIEFATRSGNSETPDENWSSWSTNTISPDGAAIASPKARYLQWRAVLSGSGESPVLTSVTAAYLQRNLRPTVRSITVHPPGIVFQKPFTTGEPDLAGFGDQTTPDRKLTTAAQTTPGASSSSPALGRRTYQKGLQTLAWRADDENDDDLVYAVLYRREGETTWTPLRSGLEEPILVWDTTLVPNGTYFVRVIASDSPSNPPSTALSGERDSTAIQIDHTPPVISISAVRPEGTRTTLVFDVKDADSPVSRVEYSRDGGARWTAVFPTDGIADSKTEHYELVIEGEIGESGVTIRASDSMNNTDTTHVSPPKSRR